MLNYNKKGLIKQRVCRDFKSITLFQFQRIFVFVAAPIRRAIWQKSKKKGSKNKKEHKAITDPS